MTQNSGEAPVPPKWEFGSLEWCQVAAQTGVALLEKAHLEIREWGFSYLAEVMAHPVAGAER